MKYHKPYALEIETNEKCQFGCENVGRFKFKNNKICCENHHNKCVGKRKNYTKIFNKDWAKKSLETRIKLGITKTSQIKATETRKKANHYKKLAKRMQELWNQKPWSCGAKSEFKRYKNTNIAYQGTYEYNFLNKLENTHDLNWIQNNVSRGLGIWYFDTESKSEKLYLPDFLIKNTIYEIKSLYTLNYSLQRNVDKFNSTIYNGYKLIVVLEEQEIEYTNETEFLRQALGGSIQT